MKKRNAFILGVFFLIGILSFSLDTEYRVIYSTNSSGKLDINKATLEEMLQSGVAASYTKHIIDFRETKGSIEKIDELVRVSGIGEKTVEKLKEDFYVDEIPETNPLYINTVDDKTLIYYGFSKKEVKEIREYIESKERISNNLELKKIIPTNKYEKYKDIIKYNMY